MLKNLAYIMTAATIIIFIKVFSGQVGPPSSARGPEVLWIFPLITIVLWIIYGLRLIFYNPPDFAVISG